MKLLQRIRRRLGGLRHPAAPSSPRLPPPSYHHDNLATWHKNVAFLEDPRFVAAYRHGMNSGHKICRSEGSTEDIHIEWRIHVALWAATHASKLPGDFVECGVNTGILSLAICHYLNFNSLDKSFYLFDTFSGIPEEQMTDAEIQKGRREENAALYSECFETAKRNFAPFQRAVLVRGRVPDTLGNVPIESVAYLSLDMNIAYPELAAITFFWPKLTTGALVLLDDYGWIGYSEQKTVLDDFAGSKGVSILTLPTGQGLLIKP